MLWIFPLIAVIFFELVADVFSKEWSLKGRTILWVGAFSSYLIANIFWLFVLKNGSGLTRGVVIFSVATAVIASIIGIYFYHETLTKVQMTGIVLGLVSLVLIFWD